MLTSALRSRNDKKQPLLFATTYGLPHSTTTLTTHPSWSRRFWQFGTLTGDWHPSVHD